jgi:cell division septation protein DedD
MSRLLDDDQELETQQRELTLSTGAILAIFLGLVLLCAVFFGFGYNLGRRSTTAPTVPPIAAANQDQPAATNSSAFDNFKPSPSSRSSFAPAPAATSTPPSSTVTVETQPPPAVTHTTPAPPHPAPATTAPTTPTAPPPATHTAPTAPQATPGGSFVVQIAAISSSHKDDADLLVNALHNKGYDVAEHTEQDKLIHIQVGPFATKADAEAMRERLIIDGYNAIVK